MTDLRKRALTRLAAFQIALGVLLFAPAWSLRSWQAWVYWALIGVAALASTLYFLKHDPALVQRRLRGGPTAERTREQKIIVTVISVLFAGLFIASGVERRFHPPAFPPAIVLAGDAVVVASSLLSALVLRANSHASAVVEVTEGQRVISTGPYGIVRHPLYSSVLLMLLATPAALASLWAVPFAALLVAAIVARLLAEERFLVENLPGYADYRREVRYRLVPRVW